MIGRKGEVMKRLTVLLVIASTLIVGCSGGLKSKLIGSWKIDSATVKMPDIPDAMKNDPNIQKVKDQMMEGMGKMRIEFKADGTVVATGMNENKPAKWSLKGNEIVLVDEKGQVAKDGKATITDDGSRIHLTPSDPKGLGFDLVKA
jgi:hypothetical protein